MFSSVALCRRQRYGVDEIALQDKPGAVSGLHPIAVSASGFHVPVHIGTVGAAGVLDLDMELTRGIGVLVAAQYLEAGDRRISGVVPGQGNLVVGSRR